MSVLSNSSPFVKIIEDLKKEAEVINRSYKSEIFTVKLDDYQIENDKDETDTGVLQLSGKTIDTKKFCAAELGGKYIDLFVGNERAPKLVAEILDSAQKVSYSEAKLVNDPGNSTMIFVAYNHAIAKGDVSVEDPRAQDPPVIMSTNIFSTSQSGAGTVPQDLYMYSCGEISSTEVAGALNTALITNKNEVLSQSPAVDAIDRYKSPGAAFFSHAFTADKKSILGINFSLQDADILHAFLNGLNTLDLTKAITFLRIGFFSPSVAVPDPRSKDRNAIVYKPPISLASSLGMNSATILQKNYSSALTEGLIAASAGASPYLRGRSLSRVGFEIFLAPQTLVNPDINSAANQSGFRKFPVRDPMVPIASVDSFKVTVQNSPIAAFTSQVCDLKITVHDKSRLEELSSLIAVQDFPSNFLEIEYGYSHPDSDPVTGTAVGRFLNLMKMKQVYTVAGYSMSIKDQSAEISLKLVSFAEKAITSVPCITGFLISVKTVLQYLNNMTLTQFPDLFPKGSIQFDSLTSAGRMVERSLFIDVVDAVSRSASPKEDDNVKRAIKALTDAIVSGNSSSGTTLTPNQIQERAIGAAEDFGIGTARDRFFQQIDAANSNGFSFQDTFKKNHKEGKFVSAAQLISRFVLAPLASSTIFDEVQIHCFSFNDRAGYLSKQPISICPVDMQNLKTRLSYETAMKTSKIYSTAEVLNAILKECSNPHNVGFGVSDAVKSVQDARKAAEEARAAQESVEVSSPAEKTAEESKAEAQLTSKIKDIYTQVYGRFPDDPVFTVPRVRSTLQPLKKTIEEGPNAGKEINICKIIIYDEACTSLSEISSILGVASEDLTTYQPKVSNTDAGLKRIGTGARDDIKFVRSLLRKLYPTLKIGSGNSVVNGVNISTNTSGEVAQAQLVEALRGVYGSQQEAMPESAGEDITIIPAKLSFSMPGCPIVSRGQSIFVDMGTGTTLDNVYTVSSISHNIDSRGNFTTSVSLSPTSGGTVRGVSTKLERALKKFSSATSGP